METTNDKNRQRRKVKITFWEKDEVNPNVENLIYNWQLDRNEYPGWLLLPYTNRNKLWNSTKYHHYNIIHHFDVITKPNNILILYEFYWRFNKCLIPLSIDEEIIIEKTAKYYNPFEEKSGNSIIDTEFINRENVKEAWIFLLKLLLSDARRDLNYEKFRDRFLMLEKLENIIPGLYDFISYEKCLFNLSKFDEKGLHDQLKSWKIDDSNTLYNAKKASILAEIGNTDSAKALAEKTLNNIRKQYYSSTPDYYLLSLESWVMMLNHSFYLFMDDDFFELRLEKLKNYKCDPYSEFEILFEELKKPEPLKNPNKKEIVNFDSDVITESSFSGSDDGYSYLPAYSLLRLYEETCLPMNQEKFHYNTNDIFIASKWIKRGFRIWSLSCLLRSNYYEEKNLDEFIDRFYVATLEDKDINIIVNNFLPSLEYSINNLSINKLNFNFTSKAIYSLSDLLSKIVIRGESDLKWKLFELALILYSNPKTRDNDLLIKANGKLFKRILEVMSQKEILDILKKLVELPVKGEANFFIKEHSNWEDPFKFIEFKENTALSENERMLINNRVDELLRLVKEGKMDSRNAAIWRICKLLEIKALSEKQINIFVNSLYSQLNEYSLPDSNLFDHSFLLLPMGNNNVKDLIKAKYLSSEIPKISHRYYENEKLKSISSGGSYNTQYYIKSLIHISEPLIKTKEKRDIYIKWNAKEAGILLKKIIEFWDYEKEDYDEFDDNGFFSRSSSIKAVAYMFDKLLSRVLIPNLDYLNGDIRSILSNFIAELEEKNTPIQSSKVLMLLLEPNNSNKLLSEIRKGYNSLSKTSIKNNLDALFLWLVYSSNNIIEKPNVDFIKELLDHVISRRQPGLLEYIKTLNQVIKYLPDSLNDCHLSEIQLALEILFNELNYKNYEKLRNTVVIEKRNIETIIYYSELPNYREIISELCFNIYTQFDKKKRNRPPIFEEWKDSCINDPLPEVRYFWTN